MLVEFNSLCIPCPVLNGVILHTFQHVWEVLCPAWCWSFPGCSVWAVALLQTVIFLFFFLLKPQEV